MYADYGQMQKYEEYLKGKASEFQDAQTDAAWVMMWFGRGVNKVGNWLVWWGQRLQARYVDKGSSISLGSLFTRHTL